MLNLPTAHALNWIALNVKFNLTSYEELSPAWVLQNLDSGLDHGLTAIQALINCFHYNITVLPIYTHSSLILDRPHLNNNIYDMRLMKIYHGADADSDQFI